MGNFLTKLRAGHYGLAKTFWLYGCLLGLALGFIGIFSLSIPYRLSSSHIQQIINNTSNLIKVYSLPFYIGFSYNTLIIVIVLAYYLILAISIWNAAKLYKGREIWKALAMLCAATAFSLSLLLLCMWMICMETYGYFAVPMIALLSYITFSATLYFPSVTQKACLNKISMLIIIVLTATCVFALDRDIENHPIKYLGKDRLFDAIFRIYPQEIDKLKMEYQTLEADILYRTSMHHVSTELIAVADSMASKYLNRHIITSSDASIYNMTRKKARALHSLKDYHKVCVNFFLRDHSNNRAELTRYLSGSLMAEVIDAEVNVVENSISKLTLPLLDRDFMGGPLGKKIATLYTTKGYDSKDLARVNQIKTLPANEGCKIATEFYDVLLSLDERESAYFLRNLTYYYYSY